MPRSRMMLLILLIFPLALGPASPAAFADQWQFILASQAAHETGRKNLDFEFIYMARRGSDLTASGSRLLEGRRCI